MVAKRWSASSIKNSKTLIQQTVEAFGKINILFLNAGVFKALPLNQLSEKHFDEIYDINIKDPLITANVVINDINDSGTIIFCLYQRYRSIR